jgi:hypothetical protein
LSFYELFAFSFSLISDYMAIERIVIFF